MRFPTLDEAIACNEAVRGPDEFSPGAEDDDLDRVAGALQRARVEDNPIDAAAALAFEVAAAQGFYEGNKRPAAILASWFISQNTDLDVNRVIPPNDHELGDLLVAAARGEPVRQSISEVLHRRAAAE